MKTLLALLVGCSPQGLNHFSDDFESYSSSNEVFSKSTVWFKQTTFEGNSVELAEAPERNGGQAMKCSGRITEQGGTSKASLFINDLALLSGTTVEVSASYWLEQGSPFLLDLEENSLIGAGPGMRLVLDSSDQIWVERRKYAQKNIYPNKNLKVVFPRKQWVRLKLIVALEQNHSGTIEVFIDDQLVISEEHTKTLPTDILYAVQGTRGLYTNAEFGVTAVGEGDSVVWVDDVKITTL